MDAKEFTKDRVGEKAELVGTVQVSRRGVFYNKVGHWLGVKDKTGGLWVFTEKNFKKNATVKATGTIEMNYDQVSLIAEEIEELDGGAAGKK